MLYELHVEISFLEIGRMPMNFKKLPYLLISLLVFAFFLFSSPNVNADATNSCASIFSSDLKLDNSARDLSLSPAFPQDPATLQKVKSEIEDAKIASLFFMSELRKESDSLKATYRDKVIELDYLCLGAGPQCAAASLVLGTTNKRSLVVEKTDLIAKTFAEKDFFINSTEGTNLTMHNFPGGVGSLADFTSQKYAHSLQLAAHIQAQQYASGVPVLLNTTVVDAKVLTEKGISTVEILTAQGLRIRTKNFIIGTGLGEIGTKVRDQNYKTAFAENQQNFLAQTAALFPIMSADALLTAIKNSSAKQQTLSLPKRLIVIGDGDGSRIAIEGLSSANVNLPERLKISWVGNNFSTPEEYLASRNGGDRYVHKIIPFYERAQISGTPGHVQSWKRQENGSMQLTVTDKDTGITQMVEGDMIIDATGYDNSVPFFLKNLGAKAELQDIVGSLPELNLTSTVLARQATAENGQKLPVYVIGSAAGGLGTAIELVNSPNKNPMAIFNTAPRTSKFTSDLLQIPEFTSLRGAKTERLPTRSAQEIIEAAKKLREQQKNKPLSYNWELLRELQTAA